MSAITWDDSGKKFYETGVDHGVLYPMGQSSYGTGVAWNGLTGVTESPSGAEATKLYADNIKYLEIRSAEEFGGTIEAYTYPDEFAECDGSAALMPGLYAGQQPRKVFGLSYRTILGNDVELDAYAYKLHLVYGCTASPSERSYATVNDSPEAITFSWEFSSTPVQLAEHKPVSCLTIDSSKIDPEKMAALEAVLYGSVSADPRLPLPAEVVSILGSVSGSVKLTALSIGTQTLVPAFDPDVLSYNVATTNASDTVSATAESEAAATITVNGSSHTSGNSASWNSGTNTVVVTVTKSGATSRSYTVTVTKNNAE